MKNTVSGKGRKSLCMQALFLYIKLMIEGLNDLEKMYIIRINVE